MTSLLSKNFYELLGLPVSMTVDQVELRERYRHLMKEVHPDRHVGGTDAQQVESVRITAYLNDAWDTLRDPLKRAIYLLTLKGVVMEEGSRRDIDPAFLMEQMELREQLEECTGEPEALDRLDLLERETGGHIDRLVKEFASEYDSGDYESATKTVAKLQFMTKFNLEIENTREKLEDEA